MIDPRTLQMIVEAEHRERLENLERFRVASQYGTTHPLHEFLMQAGAGLIERAKGLRGGAAPSSSLNAHDVLNEAIKTSTGTFPAVS
ncbi:MAG: hypothetical protein H7175_08635 [Burkholderiales bacterium]|nr:hypothetical protein [Anaerolineae bacterium]